MTTPPNLSHDVLREYLRGKSFQIGLEDLSVRPKVHYYYLSHEAIMELMSLIDAHTEEKVREARKSKVVVDEKYLLWLFKQVGQYERCQKMSGSGFEPEQALELAKQHEDLIKVLTIKGKGDK